MNQQVVIIGGGPSGTFLALILARANIDVLVLEKKTKEYVLSRIRAGVLEWNTVEMLRKNGVGSRMDKEGHIHEGTLLSSSNKQLLYPRNVAGAHLRNFFSIWSIIW